MKHSLVDAEAVLEGLDQFAPLAPKIQAALKGITDKPVRFIINTHYHGDHYGSLPELSKRMAIKHFYDHGESAEKDRPNVAAFLTTYADIVFWFQLAYALGYMVFGNVVDRIGSRLGYAAAFLIWTGAHMLHAIAHSVFGFAAVRFLLGIGESGNFPAGLKAVTEWFPKKERAFATGIEFASDRELAGAIAEGPSPGCARPPTFDRLRFP